MLTQNYIKFIIPSVASSFFLTTVMYQLLMALFIENGQAFAPHHSILNNVKTVVVENNQNIIESGYFPRVEKLLVSQKKDTDLSEIKKESGERILTDNLTVKNIIEKETVGNPVEMYNENKKDDFLTNHYKNNPKYIHAAKKKTVLDYPVRELITTNSVSAQSKKRDEIKIKDNARHAIEINNPLALNKYSGDGINPYALPMKSIEKNLSIKLKKNVAWVIIDEKNIDERFLSNERIIYNPDYLESEKKRKNYFKKYSVSYKE